MTKEKAKARAKVKAKKEREDAPVLPSLAGPPRVLPAAALRAQGKAKEKVFATTSKRETAPKVPSVSTHTPKTDPNPLEDGLKRATNHAHSSPREIASSAPTVETNTAAAVARARATLLPRPKGKGKRQGKGKAKAAAPAVAAPAVSILKIHVPKTVPGSVALAASNSFRSGDNYRSWLLDTGCKHDLTSRDLHSRARPR